MADFQTNFYFSVTITGDSSASDAAFQEASGFNAQLDVEEVASGGENRFKFRLPTAVTYQNLVLKRGVTTAASPLVAWCKQIFSGGFAQPVVCKNVLLNLLDQNGKTSMSWSFVKAYPVKWSIGDLKSQESSVLIESVELAYQYVDVSDPRASA